MSADVDYLRLAVEIAIKHSGDPYTQNGAVLVANENGQAVEAVAANGLPPGVATAPDRLERPLKYSFVEHAERGAIYAAARKGLKTAGGTLYCPWFACADCARAIICAGVSRVVGHVKPRIYTPERWAESIMLADQMLLEAGVQVDLLKDDLGVRYLFNGAPFEI
jgi:dCMP deaminase